MPHFTRNFPDKTLVDRVLCKLDGSKPHFLQAEIIITPCEKLVCHKCFAEYISFIGEYVADRCSYECILCDRVHSYKIPFEIHENYFKSLDFDFKSIYAYVLQTLRSFQMEIKDRFLNRHTILERQQEFIKEEIQISIESLRDELSNRQNLSPNEIECKLDDVQNRLRTDLDVHVNTIKNCLMRMTSRFEELLENRLLIAESEILDEIEFVVRYDDNEKFMFNLRQCESYMRLLNEFHIEFNLLIKSLRFVVSHDNVDSLSMGQVVLEPYIGKLTANRKNTDEKRMFVAFVESLGGLCKLDGGRLLLTDNCRLFIVDSKYKILKSASSLNNVEINWIDYICTNQIDTIYVCMENKIQILTDQLTPKTNDIYLTGNVHGLAYANKTLFVLFWNQDRDTFIDSFTEFGDFRSRLRFTKDHLKCLKKSRNHKLIDYSLQANKTSIVLMIYKPECCYSKFFIYDLDGTYRSGLSLVTRNLFFLTDRQLITFYGTDSSSIELYHFNSSGLEHSYALHNHGSPVYARDCINNMVMVDNKLIMSEFRACLIFL